MVGGGECTIDHLATVEGLPQPGEKRRLHAYEVQAGGQVASALVGLARLGRRCAFHGAVGDDPGADVTLAALDAAGVDRRGVRVVEGASTQTAMVLVDRATGERTIAWHRAPGIDLPSDALDLGVLEGARALHLDSGFPRAAVAAARAARAAGLPVVLDADEPEGLDELMGLVDFPIVSRSFAEKLSGRGSTRDALRVLAGHGARVAVVTLGREGALALAGGRFLGSEAFRIEARDTTGAGDAFHAGFIDGLLAGLGLGRTLERAHAVAALNCRSLGAQGGLPDRAALEGFLEGQQADSGPDATWEVEHG